MKPSTLSLPVSFRNLPMLLQSLTCQKHNGIKSLPLLWFRPFRRLGSQKISPDLPFLVRPSSKALAFHTHILPKRSNMFSLLSKRCPPDHRLVSFSGLTLNSFALSWVFLLISLMGIIKFVLLTPLPVGTSLFGSLFPSIPL